MSIDCSKKELNKFCDECIIWMEKSLENASLSSVLYTDLVEIFLREKLIPDIFKAMQASYLERNLSIIQNMAALRITKPEEVQITACLHRIVESYRLAQLDFAPLESRCLLHLTTLLSGDALCEKVKEYLIEKMILPPNIQTQEEVYAYIQSHEGDNSTRRNTHDKAKIHRVREGDGDPPGAC